LRRRKVRSVGQSTVQARVLSVVRGAAVQRRAGAQSEAPRVEVLAEVAPPGEVRGAAAEEEGHGAAAADKSGAEAEVPVGGVGAEGVEAAAPLPEVEGAEARRVGGAAGAVRATRQTKVPETEAERTGKAAPRRIGGREVHQKPPLDSPLPLRGKHGRLPPTASHARLMRRHLVCLQMQHSQVSSLQRTSLDGAGQCGTRVLLLLERRCSCHRSHRHHYRQVQ